MHLPTHISTPNNIPELQSRRASGLDSVSLASHNVEPYPDASMDLTDNSPPNSARPEPGWSNASHHPSTLETEMPRTPSPTNTALPVTGPCPYDFSDSMFNFLAPHVTVFDLDRSRHSSQFGDDGPSSALPTRPLWPVLGLDRSTLTPLADPSTFPYFPGPSEANPDFTPSPTTSHEVPAGSSDANAQGYAERKRLERSERRALRLAKAHLKRAREAREAHQRLRLGLETLQRRRRQLHKSDGAQLQTDRLPHEQMIQEIIELKEHIMGSRHPSTHRRRLEILRRLGNSIVSAEPSAPTCSGNVDQTSSPAPGELATALENLSVEDQMVPDSPTA